MSRTICVEEDTYHTIVYLLEDVAEEHAIVDSGGGCYPNCLACRADKMLESLMEKPVNAKIQKKASSN